MFQGDSYPRGASFVEMGGTSFGSRSLFLKVCCSSLGFEALSLPSLGNDLPALEAAEVMSFPSQLCGTTLTGFSLLCCRCFCSGTLTVGGLVDVAEGNPGGDGSCPKGSALCVSTGW